MKKLMIVLTALLLVTAFVMPADAMRGGGKGQGYGFCNGNDLSGVQGLNLTAEQKTKISDLRTAHLKDVKPLQDKMHSKAGDLTAAAKALGLDTVWVGAFDEQAVSEVIQLPPVLRPIAMLPIGYAGKEAVIRPRRELKDLVHERNNLIHQDLAEFDPNAEESCRRWITRLDEQNERIEAQHRELKQLLDLHNEAAKHILTFMQSEEYRLEWDRAQKKL